MSFRILPPDISSRSLFQSSPSCIRFSPLPKKMTLLFFFIYLMLLSYPATVLFEWGRGKVAELVYRLTLIDWEPIRAIIISSEAEMDAWPFMALISPSFIPLML